jgi:hypothetical protein
MHPQAARSYMTPKSGRRGAKVLQQAARLGGTYEGRGANVHQQAATGRRGAEMHPQAARSYMAPKIGRREANVLQQAARLGGTYEGRGAKLHPQAALGSILASTQKERERGEEHTCIHRPLWGAYLHLPKSTLCTEALCAFLTVSSSESCISRWTCYGPGREESANRLLRRQSRPVQHAALRVQHHHRLRNHLWFGLLFN